jgi:hypothetical protein
MKKAEWEKAHNYTRNHNCPGCKHVKAVEFLPGRMRYKCEIKARAGCGKVVKTPPVAICGNMVCISTGRTMTFRFN